MALTADEETRLRALLAALERLPDVATWSLSVIEPSAKRAVTGIEGFLREVVGRLRRI